MKKRLEIIILTCASFAVSAAPLAVLFIINFDKYTRTVGGGVKLAFGGLIAAILILFKALGRLKIPNGITLNLVAFLLCYLLEPVLNDLVLLTGMSLIGSSVEFIFIHPIIKKARQDITIGKTASATAKEVKAVLEEYGIGRV